MRTDLYAMTTLEMKLMGKRSLARRANSTSAKLRGPEHVLIFLSGAEHVLFPLLTDALEQTERSTSFL